MIYVGGHSRFEDKTESNAQDFISICKTALKREINEEIGISVALNNIQPVFLYSNETETSKKHLAVCFIVPVAETSVKLKLDSHELVLNKGKSKSGKLLDLSEIKHLDLEDWSSTILRHYFNTYYQKQLSMLEFFDYIEELPVLES